MTALHDATLSQRFERFHADNPNVYATLARLAREWARATHNRKIGMKSLFEVARWQLVIETNDPNYRLNNSFTPYYARLLMLQEPDLRGIFDLRVSEADEWIERVAA